MAFFGLTGLVLDGLDLLESSPIVLVISLAMGLITGQVTVAVFRSLSASETSTAAGPGDYIGSLDVCLLAWGRALWGSRASPSKAIRN